MPEYKQNGNGELPPELQNLLSTWPATGSGTRAVHRHILTLANRLRHYVDCDQAVHLIRGAMPRRAKRGEIEETIAKAYGLSRIPKADTNAVPDHLPDIPEIENIVAERIGPGSALKKLESLSQPIPASTTEILHTLFPVNALICVGSAVDNVRTLAPSDLRNPERCPWVVPNPMSASYSVDEEGRRHPRSLANTGPRRFIVVDIDIKSTDRHGAPTVYAALVEKWRKRGVSLQDAAAALLGYLSEYGPLTMVVYSGNISLQGWFFCAGEDESEDSHLRAFFGSAVILGADRTGWTRCQLFRMPAATNPRTKRRQTIHYFNPLVIER
jgi:hypothetical protein